MENTSSIEQHDKMRTSVRTQLESEVVTWYEVNNSTAQPVPPVKVSLTGEIHLVGKKDTEQIQKF